MASKKIAVTFSDNLWARFQHQKSIDLKRSSEEKNYREFMGVSFTDSGYIKYLLWRALLDD